MFSVPARVFARVKGLVPAALLAALLLSAPAAISTVSAQSLEAIDAAQAELAAAWDAAPLSFRKALFANQIEAFGVYEPKQGAVYSPGEQIVVYAEPVGYGYLANEDGTYSFGFDFDLLVKTEEGTIMGGQEKFARTELKSRVQNREFLVTLTLSLDGAPAGNYVLEYLAHDIASDETATIQLPFTIAD